MLKIWKQAWKKDDTNSSQNDSGRNSSQHSQASGTGDGGPSLDSTVTVPLSSDHAAQPDMIHHQAGKTRPPPAHDDSGRPTKRLKSEHVPASSMSLAQDAQEQSRSQYYPTTTVILYDSQAANVESPLSQKISMLDTTETMFLRQHKDARRALVELGSCAADSVWRRSFKEIDDMVSRDCDQDDGHPTSSPNHVQVRSHVQDIIKNWAFTMPNLNTTSLGFNVSSKFLRLVEILRSCKPFGDSFRGIVFVHRRIITYIITDLLRIVDHTGFLRPCALTGLSENREQHDILNGFESGTYNLLIATKSFEDLDIPKASIVICFNLFESHSSNACLLSKTRGCDSHFVYMAEKGNDRHRHILSNLTQLGAKMQQWNDKVLASPNGAVPPPEFLEAKDPYHSESESDDDSQISEGFLPDPVSGARIYLKNATTVIYRFAASLSAAQSGSSDLFDFHSVPATPDGIRKYVCTVLLPEGSSIRQVSGGAQASISKARREACYQACLEIFKLGLLESRFFPLLPKRFETSVNKVRSATEVKDVEDNTNFGKNSYVCSSPTFWRVSEIATHATLYPTVIYPESSLNSLCLHAPILLLTWQPLPMFAKFRLFNCGGPMMIRCLKGAPLVLTDQRLQLIYAYTLRVCRALANKPLECILDKMLYFIAPLSISGKDDAEVQASLPNLSDHIPWNAATSTAENWAVSLRWKDIHTLTKDLEDAVVLDRRTEFTRRHDVVCVRPDLSPMSKPVDSPREAPFDNLLEYCKAHRKGFEGLEDNNQPLIEVSRVLPVINNLNPTCSPTTLTKAPAKYLIPELCAKFTIPSSVFRTALLLPSITRRIDDFLIVKELNARFFDHAIFEHYLLSAISAPSACVEFDYERLELLGDSFLKYLSSIYVFVTEPAHHEGVLHSARQRIISNKALFQHAKSVGLPAFIQAKPFIVKTWKPPNFILEPAAPRTTSEMEHTDNACDKVNLGGTNASQEVPELSKGKKRQKKKRDQDGLNTQWLGDKAIADVAEAIIGAAYLSGGQDVALQVTKALNIPITNIDRWSDFGRKALAPPPDVTAKLRPGSIEAVESIIGHKFDHPHLLAQALTHASIHGHGMTSYERLEFLGDAILDFMVIRYIYDRDTSLSPGALTLLKGAMVSNSALAAVCVSSGLQDHLLFESHILATSIQSYLDQLKVRQREEYELATQEGRNPGQYWLDIEPPKTLSDVVESVIGAVYLSDNFSVVGAEAFFNKVLKPFYDKHITLKTLSHHPTKILFELFQAQGCQQFQIVKQKDGSFTTCDVVVHDVVLASAQDPRVASAARRACLFALDALEGDAQFLMRTCDCRAHARGKKAQNNAIDKMMLGLEEEDAEIAAVEDALLGGNILD